MATDNSTPSISFDDAAALPLTLRHIARAFLDPDHLLAASGVPTEAAEQAVADERCGAVLAVLADGFTVVEGAPVPGACTVCDATGRSRLYLHYREAQYPIVEVFGENGEVLGAAHMAVQFPLLADEEDSAGILRSYEITGHRDGHLYGIYQGRTPEAAVRDLLQDAGTDEEPDMGAWWVREVAE